MSKEDKFLEAVNLLEAVLEEANDNVIGDVLLKRIEEFLESKMNN